MAEIDSSWLISINLSGNHFSAYIYIIFIECIVFFNATVPFFLYRLPLDLSTCSESLANEKFGPHLLTILDAKYIEAIYELWGVDYALEIELPGDDEISETEAGVLQGLHVAFRRRRLVISSSSISS